MFKCLPSNLSEGRKKIDLYELFNINSHDNVNRLSMVVLIKLKDDYVE
jgi:hypothetical protein